MMTLDLGLGDFRMAELGRDDGAGGSPAHDVAFAGEHRVGGVDRASGRCELAGERPGGRQAIKLAGPDRGSEVFVDLPINRDIVGTSEDDFGGG
jgi:hypothetical protein